MTKQKCTHILEPKGVEIVKLNNELKKLHYKALKTFHHANSKKQNFAKVTACLKKLSNSEMKVPDALLPFQPH